MNTRSRFVPGLASGALRLCALLAVFALCGTTNAWAADWAWNLTPYAWATNVGVKVSIDDRQVADKTISVNDLVDDLDATAQFHFEGQRGANGLLFDMFAVRLSDDIQGVGLPTAPGAEALFHSQLDMGIYELGGIYDPQGNQAGFALLYGTRILVESADIDAHLELDPNTTIDRSYETGDTLVDAMVGVRYVKRFTRHWSSSARLDASSGGTQLTWSATSTIAYTFGERDRYALTAGYRRMDFDFKDEDPVQVDMSLSGAFVGFRFNF